MHFAQQAPGHSFATPPKSGAHVNMAFAVPTVKPGMTRVVEHGGGTVSRFGSGQGKTPVEGITQNRRGVVSIGGASSIPFKSDITLGKELETGLKIARHLAGLPFL